MEIQNINIGDKFATYNKMVAKLGLEKPSGSRNKISQEKEIARFLNYEKTGKLNRNGAISNEVIITEIYDTPLEKIETRGRKGEYAVPMKEFLKNIDTGSYTNAQLMEIMGVIVSRDFMKVYKNENENRKIKSYKYYFKTDFQNKVTGALEATKKQLGMANYRYEITYKLRESENQPFHLWKLATEAEKNYIKKLKDTITDEMEKLYDKTFNSIKFDKKLYLEFQEKLDEIVLEKMGYYAHCTIYHIENFTNKKFDFDVNSGKVLRYLYIKKMRERILTYSFDFYDKEKKSLKTFGGGAFGRRNTMINNKIYYLRDEKVIGFHNKLFGDNFELGQINNE